MTRTAPALFFVLVLAGCGREDPAKPFPNASLTEARKGFQTKLTRRETANEAVETPPATVFQVVTYDSPAGKLAAYLTPDPKDGKKRPAVVWITGGDCNTIGDVWSKAPRDNDQTASAFREAGAVMMFPSLRGGNKNPGVKEGFLGEVDDVIAAAAFLAKQPHVDPARIYLGGHSTGGTLVVLVAASTDKFRAVFSFGPADEVSNYPSEFCPFDQSDAREVAVRSPVRWVGTIQTPTFVFEGAMKGNVESLQALGTAAAANPKVKCYPVRGATHFSLLAPLTKFLAAKVLADTGPATNLAFTEDEVNRAAAAR